MITNKKPVPVGSSINVLATGTIIKGNVSAEEDMRVDGLIEGNINCKGKVVISQTGEVRGHVICANIELAGKVTGNIQTMGVLVLKHTSIYHGELHVQSLEIEPGAIFNGTCKMMNAASSN